jgi:hypothetical protein
MSFKGNMSGRISLILVIIAALALAAGAFLWLHFRSGNSNVVSFTPIAKATENAKEDPAPAVPSGPMEHTNPAEPPVKKAAAPAEPAFSPKMGEALRFSASLAKVGNVASLRLDVVDKKEIGGKNVWHFQAEAKTLNAMKLIFDLDDRFDSFSEGNGYTGVQYEMHLSERGQKVQSVQRLTSTGKEPPPDGASNTIVLPGTRDPLGMMQYLRSVNWDRMREVKSPVWDGRKLYDVRANLTGTSQVVVPAGKFTAATIDIRVFDNGAEMKDAHFVLYLANDAAHTPVLLQAVLPFAEARVELQPSIE